ALPRPRDEDNASTVGRSSGARRVARTVSVGSVPRVGGTNPGVTDSQVRLGSVQPGERSPTFGDALRRLSERAAHLYVDQGRYWYSTQPNLTVLARGRKGQLLRERHKGQEAGRRRLEAACREQRGAGAAGHVAPERLAGADG